MTTPVAPIQFQVPDSALLPAVCPLCSYSLKGLPEPRCPECGTPIEPGTVVFAREPLIGPGSGRIMRMLARGCLILSSVALLVIFAAGPMKFTTASYIAIVLVIGGLLLTLRFIDFGPGVLQFSSEGFRHGAGTRFGRLYGWEWRYRLEVTRKRGGVRLSCLRYRGPFQLSVAFDLVMPISDEQLAGLKERIEYWSQGRTTFKMVGWPVNA